MRLWDYSILLPLLVRKAFKTASITGNKVAASSSLHSLMSRYTRRTEGLSLCGPSSKSSLASILSARATLNKVLNFGFPRPISILMMVRTSVSHLSATSSYVRPSSNRAFFTASAKPSGWKRLMSAVCTDTRPTIPWIAEMVLRKPLCSARQPRRTS